MARALLLLTCSIFCLVLHAQPRFVPDAAYLKLTSHALSLYIKGNNKEAALAYEGAFNASSGQAKAIDRYYAFFAWALAGNKNKAFHHLEKAVYECGFADLEKLLREGELIGLDKDARWDKLLLAVKQNKDEQTARTDTALAAKLDSIYMEDQYLRLQSDSLQKKYGRDSKKVQELWMSIRQKDSLNTLAVKEILDTRGWLGPDVIGEKGNITLFIVIQHADSATQEQYLPLLRKAVAAGSAKPSQLALLEDRIRMKRGEKQMYGSQLISDPVTKKMKFYPIEDEPNVNKRRASVGLEPLENYAQRFGIEYTPPRLFDQR